MFDETPAGPGAIVLKQSVVHFPEPAMAVRALCGLGGSQSESMKRLKRKGTVGEKHSSYRADRRGDRTLPGSRREEEGPRLVAAPSDGGRESSSRR